MDETTTKAQLDEIALVSKDISVKGHDLYGRIDEIVFEPTRIVIIDDKPGARPYFSNKIQVWAYRQAFTDTYTPALPLFGALRQEDSGDIVWRVEFLEDHSSLIDVTVKRIRAVLDGKEPPEGPGNSRKCRPCRFKDACPACMR